MSITPLPVAPSRSSPATFAADGDAFLGALANFVTEANALLAQCELKATTLLSLDEILGTDADAINGTSSLLAVTPHGLAAKLNSITIIPAGFPAFWPVSTPPPGWLVRDGSAISRTTYAALFAVLGTAYGVGNGSTTFNLPDDRELVIGGYKSGSTEFGVFGAKYGAKTHTLTMAQLPALTFFNGSGWNIAAGGQPYFGSSTSTAGGGLAHNNIQETRIYLPIIKY